MNEPLPDWKKHWGRASRLGIGAESIDVRPYVSQEVFEDEREKIFRRTWIVVARESEVPNPDDFVKLEIPPLRTEAIVARGKDGILRAFYNTCPHRGAALVRPQCGKAHLFVCPYHAWSFATDGKCKGIPGVEDFPQLDKNKVALTPIHLDTWNGFIFLNFDEAPRQTLAQYLGEFGDLYADVPFDDCRHVVEMTMDLDTNWKNFVDAFNEGYHVSVLHRKTLPMVPSRANPLNTFYDPIFSAPHSSVTVQSNPDWVPAEPVRRFVYAATGASMIQLDEGASKPAGSGPRALTGSKGVNRIGLPNFALQFINFFPLTHVEVFVDRYMWYQFWPISVDRTRFILRLYARARPASHLQAFAEGHMLASTRDVVSEDVAMTRIQQIGMKNGGVRKLYLAENEFLIRYTNLVMQDYLTGRR